MYAQLLPGKPADDAPPGGWPGAGRYAEASADTRAARLQWFEAGLDALLRALPSDRALSVSFPARIGCGLAGGIWSHYRQALQEFARANPEWRVVVYDMEASRVHSKSRHRYQ